MMGYFLDSLKQIPPHYRIILLGWVILLPIVGGIYLKVDANYTFNRTEAAKNEEKIKALQDRLAAQESMHVREVQELKAQIQVLLQKLLKETSTITIPYTPDLQTDLKRHRVNEDQMPGFWFPISPILALDRRQLSSRFVGGREHQG